MSETLSGAASDKCKERVEMVDNKDKNLCLDPKTKKGVAMCVGFSLLKSGKAKDLSEALKMGHKMVRELCDGKNGENHIV